MFDLKSLDIAKRKLGRLLGVISDLRVAISLLLVIAISSGLGTLVPQKEPSTLYHQLYDNQPWLGLFKGDAVLGLQLDHVYSSGWFLALLAWLGLALILCSWRRQWPALQASLRWIDYQSPRQLGKLTLAETIASANPAATLGELEQLLKRQGWTLQVQADRLAARRGVAGRVGPLLVHAGLVVLMVGAAWGSLAGHRQEQFLAPGRQLDLLNSRGDNQMTVAVDQFEIERDPAGRPEQFRSALTLKGPDGATLKQTEISVNHPLRFRGITLYQADWTLAAIGVQLGRSPVLQLPLQTFPQLGDQIWGIVLPTRPDGSQPVLLSLSSEQGPVTVFSAEAKPIASLVPGGEAVDIEGLPMRIDNVLAASGILLKRDPGVPLVYGGFGIALVGGVLSLVATRQLWAISDPANGRLHLGGLCNRNLTAFARELPVLISTLQLADQTI